MTKMNVRLRISGQETLAYNMGVVAFYERPMLGEDVILHFDAPVDGVMPLQLIAPVVAILHEGYSIEIERGGASRYAKEEYLPHAVLEVVLEDEEDISDFKAHWKSSLHSGTIEHYDTPS